MSSVVPDPQRREALQFHFAKSLPYSARLMVAAVLLIGGVALEAALPPWANYTGLAFVFSAGFLLSAAGYTNRPESLGAGFWKTAETDSRDKIIDLHDRSGAWDMSALDITNGLGFLGFVAAVAAVLVTALAFVQADFQTALLVGASGAALVLPIWFSGSRAGWKNNELVLKVRILRDLLGYIESIKRPDEKTGVSLKLNGTEPDAFPTDAKLLISFPEASADFYGVQGQININNVQGNKYPYGYFVVVAKRGLGILPLGGGREVRGTVAVECSTQSDVEVIVVRQYTTRTSGYYTKPKQIRALLDIALDIAREASAGHPKTAAS